MEVEWIFANGGRSSSRPQHLHSARLENVYRNVVKVADPNGKRLRSQDIDKVLNVPNLQPYTPVLLYICLDMLSCSAGLCLSCV